MLDKKVSKLAIGTAQFGLDYGINNTFGKVNHEEIGKILDLAYSKNIRTIDTARTYGDAEAVIGQYDLSKWNIISKFNLINKTSSIEKELDISLEKLKLKNIYAYIGHSAEFFIENPIYWKKLIELRELNKIERIGFSIYKTEQLDKLLDRGCIPDLVQFQYNIFDKRFESYFQYLKSINCEIHTRSSFLQGLFFKTTLPDFFNPIKNEIKEIQQMFPLNSERAAYLLSFCLDNPFIDKVIIGVQSANELQQNLEALNRFSISRKSTISIPDLHMELLLPYNWPKN